MSDTRPTGTTHDPDAVERVAAAIYVAEGSFYGCPYQRLPDGGEFDPDTGDTGTRGYYRWLAGAALTAVESLYEDEGGARP